jgi:biopolymer transport protein ExbB
MSSFDLSSLWAQGDAVSHSVALLLLLLSILSWGVIVNKGWQLWQLRRQGAGAIDDFWQASDLESGLRGLDARRPLAPFAELARRGAQALAHYASHATAREAAPHLDAHLSAGELVTRALRQGINRALSRLDTGQTLLASIGSTAPFIGLFGTVWGVVHALGRLGSGAGGIEQVAGPVGEALVMTAAGLFVAIPAVLAYNAFNRSQRLVAADLDAFAHELHTFLTTGQPLSASNAGGTAARATPTAPAGMRAAFAEAA